MTISAARLAANRANAQRSTGPRTLAGKAASRQNAFRHGMAGAGDLLGPDEDEVEIMRRSAAFERDLGANCAVTRTLAHRAALLAVRMERASERDLVAVAAAAAAARDEFDRDRSAAIDARIESLAGDQPGQARVDLEQEPEGIVYLIETGAALLRDLRAATPAAETLADAVAWLGVEHAGRSGLDAREVTRRVEADLQRLGRLGASLGDLARAIDRARFEAGLLASFDPAPAAVLARRYEAAAERGMYRALREIAAIQRDRERERPGDDPRPAPQPVAEPIPQVAPVPAGDLTEPTRDNLIPGLLASFRAGMIAEPIEPPLPSIDRVEPAGEPAARRQDGPVSHSRQGKQRGTSA